MNREEVLKQLQSIFRDILKKDNVCIDESSTSKDVDGWDSLTHMQIIAQIEKHFGVRFNFREVIKFMQSKDVPATSYYWQPVAFSSDGTICLSC